MRATGGLKYTLKGFTLIEMMIVIAIIGVLVAAAWPSYQDFVMKSRRAEAKGFLNQVMQQEEKFYTEKLTYTTDLKTDLDYSQASPRSENSHYRIVARTCVSPAAAITECVRLIAIPISVTQLKDNECKRLILDSRGKKAETGTGTVADCW